VADKKRIIGKKAKGGTKNERKNSTRWTIGCRIWNTSAAVWPLLSLVFANSVGVARDWWDGGGGGDDDVQCGAENKRIQIAYLPKVFFKWRVGEMYGGEIINVADF
jgi:hypothetical protein